MTDTVNIIGMRDVLRRFSLLRHEIASPAIMEELGLFFIAKIEIRTAEGKDVDGSAFEPYSESYRLYREAAGHSGSKVNLFFTGSLMSSLTYEVKGNDTVRLFFQNTADPSGTRNPAKAFYINEGTENMPQRRFFAISDQERLEAIQIIERHIARLTRRRP